MSHDSRRCFFSQTATAVGLSTIAAGVLSLSAHANDRKLSQKTPKIRIVGMNGSPRRDKTTFEALSIALSAAQSIASDRIETEIIHLIDYPLGDARQLGERAPNDQESQKEILESKLVDATAIIVGSPVHNSCTTALISLFFGQTTHTLLQNKIGASLAVGGARNGGQEHVVQTLNTMLMHEGVILIGTGMAGRIGALCQNQNDTLAQDEYGQMLLNQIGTRIAIAALTFPMDLLSKDK